MYQGSLADATVRYSIAADLLAYARRACGQDPLRPHCRRSASESELILPAHVAKVGLEPILTISAMLRTAAPQKI